MVIALPSSLTLLYYEVNLMIDQFSLELERDAHSLRIDGINEQKRFYVRFASAVFISTLVVSSLKQYVSCNAEYYE